MPDFKPGDIVMIDEKEESKYRAFSPESPDYTRPHKFIETDGDRAHVEEFGPNTVNGWIVKYEALVLCKGEVYRQLPPEWKSAVVAERLSQSSGS